MIVNSTKELADHMSIGYQIAHFNYILGTQRNTAFPNGFCGVSSRGVTLSLIKFGYPNAAYAYSKAYDHGYSILPFVFSQADMNGIIIIDPTSDQLWDDKKLRNAVFLKLGTTWEYCTDWEREQTYFPTSSPISIRSGKYRAN